MTSISPATRPPQPGPVPAAGATAKPTPACDAVVPAGAPDVLVGVGAGVAVVEGLAEPRAAEEGGFREVSGVVARGVLEPTEWPDEDDVVLLGLAEEELVELEPLEVEVGEGAGGATDGGLPAPKDHPSTVPGAGSRLAGPVLE